MQVQFKLIFPLECVVLYRPEGSSTMDSRFRGTEQVEEPKRSTTRRSTLGKMPVREELVRCKSARFLLRRGTFDSTLVVIVSSWQAIRVEVRARSQGETPRAAKSRRQKHSLSQAVAVAGEAAPYIVRSTERITVATMSSTCGRAARSSGIA